MDTIKELTKAEEEIMQELWEMEGGFVKDVIERLPEPKPAYNTVSTIIRILETKGFIDHKSYGRSHFYFPKVKKEEYKKLVTKKLLNNYFDNSPSNMLSFFFEENEIDLKDMGQILEIIRKNK